MLAVSTIRKVLALSGKRHAASVAIDYRAPAWSSCLPHPKSRPGTASPGIVGLQGWQEMATVIGDWSKCEEIYISEK